MRKESQGTPDWIEGDSTFSAAWVLNVLGGI